MHDIVVDIARLFNPHLAAPMFAPIRVWIPGQLALNIPRMIDPDEKEPYRIEPESGRFKVMDWEDGVVLVCGDEPSAGQYAALMNQAYRRGFKAGIRKARNSS